MHHDLVSLFAMEQFRGAESVLLTVPQGALPTVALSDAKSPERFVEEYGSRLFGVETVNNRKIGTTKIDDYLIHVVTGDCLCPAKIHHSPHSHMRFRWVPTYELFNDRTVQAFVLALSRSRLAGWHIEPTEDGKSFLLSFTMSEAHQTLGEAINNAGRDTEKHAKGAEPVCPTQEDPA